MKKGVVIFLLLNFLIANIGVAATLHWCGGKLASINFYTSGHNCPCGKKTMKPGCCKDKTTYWKVKDDVVKNNSVVFKTATPKFLFVPVNQIKVIPSAQHLFSAADFYHPPPFKPKAPVYLLDRVFLI